MLSFLDFVSHFIFLFLSLSLFMFLFLFLSLFYFFQCLSSQVLSFSLYVSIPLYLSSISFNVFLLGFCLSLFLSLGPSLILFSPPPFTVKSSGLHSNLQNMWREREMNKFQYRTFGSTSIRYIILCINVRVYLGTY